MDLWEVVARESIRDLVARYNANGDSGRFAQVMELFAPDAQMDIDGEVKTGIDEILTIFTGVRDDLGAPSGGGSSHPAYVRHLTATHQIDIVDRHHATGRCYYQVLTRIGLDHWGRYVDQYRTVDGQWRFARREVSVDGRSPMSLFPAT
jgi:hypothetical protein